MKTILRFIKREAVLCAALALALVSMLPVPPDVGYAGYIDMRTLSILFCLMGVMAGLQGTGLFQWVAQTLLSRVRRAWQLVLILVLLCFFSSMLITNDVALIAFVPFTLTVLGLAGRDVRSRLLVPAVALQTVAANLGSMLTPAGNPQNLYLYSKAGMSAAQLMGLMLPYTALSLALLVSWVLIQSMGYRTPIRVEFSQKPELSGSPARLLVYAALFCLDLLAVLRVLPYPAALLFTVIGLLLTDRKIFLHIDYSLLLTFVGFFIFTGNMGRLPQFADILRQAVSGNEVLAGAAASQIISNVPAALLLSGFTENIPDLIVGVNLGGLGTLIASMASLISYKLVTKEDAGLAGRYFRYFTVVNLCFLGALLLFRFAFGG